MSQTDSTFTLPRGLDPIEAIAGLGAAVHLEWLEQQAIELRSQPVEDAPPLLVFLRDAYSIDKIVAELAESAELAVSVTLQELCTRAEALNAEAESQGQAGTEGEEGAEEENNKEVDASADEPIAETDATKLALPLEHRIARFVPLLCTQIESLPAAWICSCMDRVAGQLERASDRRHLRDSIDRLLEDHRLLYSKRDRGGGNYDHTTPPSIRKLMIALADPHPENELVDPCFGFGGLLTDAIDWMQAKETATGASPAPICVRGAEKNRQACLVGMARVLLSTGQCMTLLLDDNLCRHKDFRDKAQTKGRTCLLTAPPLGIDIPLQKTDDSGTPPPESIAALILNVVYHHIWKRGPFRYDGLAILLVPREAMTESGKISSFRQHLLMDEVVEAVVDLPAGIFGPTSALEMSLLILRGWGRRESPAPSTDVAVTICDAVPFFEPAQQMRERQITDEGVRRLREAMAEEQADSSGITRLKHGDLASKNYVLSDADHLEKSDFQTIFDSFEKWGRKQKPLHFSLAQLVDFGESCDFYKLLDYDPGDGWGIVRSTDLGEDTLPEPKEWVNFEDMHEMRTGGSFVANYLVPGDILIACDDDSYHVIDLQEEHFSSDDDRELIPDTSITVLIFPAGNPHSHDADQRSIDRAITADLRKVPFADDLVDRDYLLAYLRSPYVREYLCGEPKAMRERLAKLPVIIPCTFDLEEIGNRISDGLDPIDYFVFNNRRPTREDDHTDQFDLGYLYLRSAVNDGARANLECERLLAAATFVPTACQRLASELKRLAQFLVNECAESAPVTEGAVKEHEIQHKKIEIEMAELEAAERELKEAGEKDGDKELEDNRSRQNALWHSQLKIFYEPGSLTAWLRIIKDRNNWRAVRTDVAAYEKVTAWAHDFYERCRPLAMVQQTENALLQFTLLKNVAATAIEKPVTSNPLMSLRFNAGAPGEPAVNNSLNLLSANVARLSSRYLDFLLSDAELQIDLLRTTHKQSQETENADDKASVADTIFHAEQTIRVRNLGSLPLETIAFETDFNGSESQKQSAIIDLLDADTSTQTNVCLKRVKQPLPDFFELRWSATMINGKTVDGAIQLAIPSEEDAGTTRSTPVDLGSSPYICGSPIEARYADMCFGRDAELQTIRRAVQTQGNVMLLEGNRRMGKSTILHQLLANEAVPGWIGALCSLQGVSSVAQGESIAPNFYRHLGYQIARIVRKRWGSVPLPDGTTMEKSSLETLRTLIENDNPFEDFCEYLDTILDKLKAEDKGLLLMIDEFDEAQSWLDHKIDIGQIPENLRYLLQNRENLTGIMTGSIHLRQMRNQYWHPLFGIGQKISVSHLDEDASRQLITDPVKDKLTFTPDAIDLAYRQTAGQPFMLQTLCTTIFDQAAQSGVTAIGTDQIRNAIGRLAEGNEHFDALWAYCQSDQQRYLLHLIHHEGAGEPLSLDRIGGTLRDQGIAYTETELTADIELLIELEVLQRRQSAGIMRYGLAIPMMGKWIEENQDAAILTQKVTPEQTRLTLYDVLLRLQPDLDQLEDELKEEIATIKAQLEGNISSTEKSGLQKELLELEEELDRVKRTILDNFSSLGKL